MWHADDTAITAENEKKIQILPERYDKEGKHFVIKLNIKHTKTMVLSKKNEISNVKIELDWQEVLQVSKVLYLGNK